MLIRTDIPLEDELQQLAPRPRILTIRVEGEIRGKGRPKFRRRGQFVQTYTDDKTAGAENFIRLRAIQQVGQPMLEGPLTLKMFVTVVIPPSWSKRKQAEARAGMLWPTGKPDADNLAKLVSDALNGVVWRDDAQIVDLRVRKSYGDAPGALLEVAAA